MMRTFGLLLALLPSAAVAQEWTQSVVVVGGPNAASFQTSGTVVNSFDDLVENDWLASEIFQVTPDSETVDCATATELEFDHYVGVENEFILQVLITLQREADGSWVGFSPDVYYDALLPNGDYGDSYAGFDGTVKVQDLTCVGNDVRIAFSFRSDAASSEGKGGTVTINGRATQQIALLPYSQY